MPTVPTQEKYLYLMSHVNRNVRNVINMKKSTFTSFKIIQYASLPLPNKLTIAIMCFGQLTTRFTTLNYTLTMI